MLSSIPHGTIDQHDSRASVVTMKLIFPTFGEFLDELTVCAGFDNEFRIIGDEVVRQQARYDILGGSAWLRLLIESFDKGARGHIHFDIGRNHEELSSPVETVDLSDEQSAVEIREETEHIPADHLVSIEEDAAEEKGELDLFWEDALVDDLEKGDTKSGISYEEALRLGLVPGEVELPEDDLQE